MEEKIQEFVAITGTSELLAFKFLSDNNQEIDLDFALNLYFENPNKFINETMIEIESPNSDPSFYYYNVEEISEKKKKKNSENFEENYKLINDELFDYLENKKGLIFRDTLITCQTKENIFLYWKKFDLTKGNESYTFYPSANQIFKHEGNICLFGYYEGKESFKTSNLFIEPCMLNIKNLETFEFELMEFKEPIMTDEIRNFSSSIKLLFSYNGNIYSFNQFSINFQTLSNNSSLTKSAFTFFQYHKGNWSHLTFNKNDLNFNEVELFLGVVQIENLIYAFYRTTKIKTGLLIYNLKNLSIEKHTFEMDLINIGCSIVSYDGDIYFFGGETLKYFSLALIIGITSGAYSSICIAGPLLVSWYKRGVK